MGAHSADSNANKSGLIAGWQTIRIAMTAVAAVALVMLYFVPLTDIDLWWHLATGRYIVETRTLLSADPFGLAGADISPGRELILNGYWLSQIIFYGIEQTFGLGGLVALRAILLSISPLAIFLYGWRCFPRSAVVLPLVLLCGWAMVDVAGLRPNHLTIVCIPLLMLLLTSIGFVADGLDSKYNLQRAWLLPPFMLVWANLHGGFLLGVVILVLYAVGETVTVGWRKLPLRATAGLWGIIGITVIVSLITPNGARIFIQFFSFQGGALQQKTSEYLSPLALATSGVLIYWPFFILLILLLWVALICRRRLTLTRWLLLTMLAAIGLTSFRYAPLFVGAASILLFPELIVLSSQRRWRLSFDVAGIILAGVIVALAIGSYPQRSGALSRGMVDTGTFPVGATDFIAKQNLSGVIFNHFNWGGYLVWRQPGELKTFIDGRTLNLPLFHAYTRALWLPNETPGILEQNNVDLIIMPRLNPFTGELYALTDYLWSSPQWSLVYRDATAMILVKNEQLASQPGLRPLMKNLIYQDVLNDVAIRRSASRINENLEKAARVAAIRLGTNVR